MSSESEIVDENSRKDEIESDEEVKKRILIEESMSSSIMILCCSCQKNIIKEDNACNQLICSCGNRICYGCGYQSKSADNSRWNLHLGASPNCCRGVSAIQPTHLVFAKEAGEKTKKQVEEQMPGVRLLHDPLKDFPIIQDKKVLPCWARFFLNIVTILLGVLTVTALYFMVKRIRQKLSSRRDDQVDYSNICLDLNCGDYGSPPAHPPFPPMDEIYFGDPFVTG